MKSIVLISAIALVVLCCWLDVSQAQTNSSSSTATTSATGNPKTVRVSNLQYQVVRRIRVGSTTTSTSTRSSRSSRSNRNLRARRTKARRATASRRQNSRRVRG